jgi:hypothetical protein
MVWSSSSPVLAQGITNTYTYNGTVYTITNSDNGNNVTTVNVKSVDGTSTVILDKKTNLAKITEVNAQGTIILNKTVSLVVTAPKQLTVVSPAASTLIAYGSEGMWHHAYAVYKSSTKPTYYIWDLYRQYDGRSIREKSSNTADLTGYKDDVNDAAKNETTAAAAVGVGVLSAIAGALAAAGTVTLSLIVGLLILLGAGVTAAAVIYSAWVDCKDADYHYARL